MADYQLSHFTLSTRMMLVSQMLNPHRPWGQVTELAREYGVSRKFLYELQHKARASMQAGLLPQPSGRKAARNQIEIDDDFVRRAIAIGMSVVPGTVRTVQLLLELLCGVHRSTPLIAPPTPAITPTALPVPSRTENRGSIPYKTDAVTMMDKALT